MPRAEFLIVGDTHIGRLANYFPDKDWLDWTFAPLRQVEEYARNHGIRTVIQTGDLFDVANPGQELLRALADHLLRSPVNYYFGIGNHDISHRGHHSLLFMGFLSRRKRIRNAQFYTKPIRRTLDGIPIIFLPWPVQKSPLLRGRPALVIAHTERSGARYDNGRRITGNKFKLGKHFWIIGHLHEWQTFNRVIFPGAPSQLRYGDSEQKYFLHLRVHATRDKISVKYKRILLRPSYLLRDLSITRLDDLTKLDDLADNVYVRLLIQQDLAVPATALRHPRVIKHKFFGDKRDLRAIQREEFNLASAKITLHSRLGALKSWLRTQTSLPKARRRQAIRLAADLERRILS